MRALFDHTRTSIDGMTPAELKAARSGDAIVNTAEQIKTALADIEKQVNAEAPMVSVRADMFNWLNSVGRYTKTENALHAAFIARMFQAKAERLNEGMPPEQHTTAEKLYRDERMRFIAAEVGGEGALGQRVATLEQETARWQDGLRGFATSGENYKATMRTPVVLYHLGEKSKTLSLSSAYLSKIVSKHPDVPLDVMQNLPALLHDPVAAYPNRDGGVNAVIGATTEKGEPIIVGVRDGEIRTVTPVNNTTDQTGQEILRNRMASALLVKAGESHTTTYYRGESRNDEARSGLSAERASVTAHPNAPLSLEDLFRQRRNVTTKQALVNRYGERYYQYAHDPIPETIDVDGEQRPTMNSEGRPIALTEESVRNFWRFLGDSEAVDENGRPLVLKHATSEDFDTFDESYAGKNTDGNAASDDLAKTAHMGFWFNTEDVSLSSGNNISIPVYLSIRNAKHYDSLSSLAWAIHEKGSSADALREDLEDDGYDGISLNDEEFGGTSYVAFRPEQIKSSIGNRGTFDKGDKNILHQSAWHGSPHEFDRFMLEHIGTGEGHQAYGWGLYFSGSKDVAEYYRKNIKNHTRITEINAELKRLADVMAQYEKRGAHREYKDQRGYDAAKRYDELLNEKEKEGKLYEVDIPENDVLLDWDKPLSEQPGKVREALKALGDIVERLDGTPRNITGERVYREIARVMAIKVAGSEGAALSGSPTRFRGVSDRAASEYLNSLGIKGIRYLDGSSRSAGEGSHNYVIFDDKSIEMLNRYYQSGRAPVSTLQGIELGDGLSSDNVVGRARDWFKANLQGGTVEREGFGSVRISGKGWHKLKKGLTTDLDRARLIPAIPDIIRSGEYLGRFPIDKPRSDDIVAFHHFEAPVRLGDKVVQAGVSVAEDSRGNLFYNLNRDPSVLLDKRTKGSTFTQEKARGVEPSEGSAFTQEKAWGAEPFGEQSIPPSDSEINLSVRSIRQDNETVRGFYDRTQRIIGLTKDANLSTFLHETGHWFLDMNFDTAAQLLGEANGKPLPAGRQQIVDDANAVLKWMGVQDLNTWHTLSAEERRSYHEKFARAFEQYLYEGKAPSPETESVFRRIKQWMLAVYKDWSSVPGAEISPEIREVFDRMVATDEQIAQMRQYQRLEPLFRSPEEAGMTPKAFEDYLKADQDSIAAAQEEHGARVLRDTQFLHNLRNRMAKELSRESAGLRREAKAEATTEIMSEPVYRA